MHTCIIQLYIYIYISYTSFALIGTILYIIYKEDARRRDAPRASLTSVQSRSVLASSFIILRAFSRCLVFPFVSASSVSVAGLATFFFLDIIIYCILRSLINLCLEGELLYPMQRKTQRDTFRRPGYSSPSCSLCFSIYVSYDVLLSSILLHLPTSIALLFLHFLFVLFCA